MSFSENFSRSILSGRHNGRKQGTLTLNFLWAPSSFPGDWRMKLSGKARLRDGLYHHEFLPRLMECFLMNGTTRTTGRSNLFDAINSSGDIKSIWRNSAGVGTTNIPKSDLTFCARQAVEAPLTGTIIVSSFHRKRLHNPIHRWEEH